MPKGYLRGFIHPERQEHSNPLWVLDVQRRTWSQKSPAQIAWGRGFYDYSDGSEPDASADEAFLFIENRFPQLRERLRVDGYETWIEHRDFLVSCVAMLSARSPLFRIQAVSQVSQSMSASLAKNFSITLMRTELQRRSETWRHYHWVLGYTKSPEQPFVVGDQSVGMRGNSADEVTAYEQKDFWLWCPLSWDMCLIGSTHPLDAESTSELQPEHVAEIQRLTTAQSAIFIASPTVLPHLTTVVSAPA